VGQCNFKGDGTAFDMVSNQSDERKWLPVYQHNLIDSQLEEQNLALLNISARTGNNSLIQHFKNLVLNHPSTQEAAGLAGMPLICSMIASNPAPVAAPYIHQFFSTPDSAPPNCRDYEVTPDVANVRKLATTPICLTSEPFVRPVQMYLNSPRQPQSEKLLYPLIEKWNELLKMQKNVRSKEEKERKTLPLNWFKLENGLQNAIRYVENNGKEWAYQHFVNPMNDVLKKTIIDANHIAGPMTVGFMSWVATKDPDTKKVSWRSGKHKYYISDFEQWWKKDGPGMLED
jgi:hypothetical protein